STAYRTDPKLVWQPFDLNPDTGRVRHRLELLDPDAGAPDAPVLQEHVGDAFGERLHQMDMARLDEGADLAHHLVVAHHRAEVAVHDREGFVHRQVHIDADLLLAALFLVIDADGRGQRQVTHEDMTDRTPGVGDLQGLHVADVHGLLRSLRRAHSSTSASGVCQARCWPPSSAIIWPVMD